MDFRDISRVSSDSASSHHAKKPELIMLLCETRFHEIGETFPSRVHEVGEDTFPCIDAEADLNDHAETGADKPEIPEDC